MLQFVQLYILNYSYITNIMIPYFKYIPVHDIKKSNRGIYNPLTFIDFQH